MLYQFCNNNFVCRNSSAKLLITQDGPIWAKSSTYDIVINKTERYKKKSFNYFYDFQFIYKFYTIQNNNYIKFI